MFSELVLDDVFVTVRVISVSEMENNVYLVTDKASGGQVLVDAADDASAILGLCARALESDFVGEGEPVGLYAVLTTHSHWDHIRALPEVVERTGADTFAGELDAAAIVEQEGVVIDQLLEDDEVLIYGSFVLSTVHLRGHTPGSLAYVLMTEDDSHPPFIFSGDSLFPGGVGKTDSAENFSSLLDDVEAKLFGVYGDDTVILPGHGKATTLGAERASLPVWRQRGW